MFRGFLEAAKASGLICFAAAIAPAAAEVLRNVLRFISNSHL